MYCCAGGDFVTDEEQTLAEIKARIETLPRAERARLDALAYAIRVLASMEPHGLLALALVGAELAAKE
jgi:hypothetical protein